jgi:lipoate-protein ligase A
MAIDEALLVEVGSGASPATLRFYQWRSPWVSLGSAQESREIAGEALAARGWGLVRRASGGTAVLHCGQLGYALILPANHPILSGDLIASYERLSEPLRVAFGQIGVSAQAAPPSAKGDFARGAPALASRFCFAALGPYELVCQGRKLIGNSQIRRRAAATQHGVIQISGDQADLVDVIPSPTEVDRNDLRDFLHKRVSSLEACAHQSIAAAMLADALVAAFTDRFGIHFECGNLTDAERCATTELLATKYRDPAWTFRR